MARKNSYRRCLLTRSRLAKLRWLLSLQCETWACTWFDSHPDMSVQVTKACGRAFFYLYNIRHIRKYLSHKSTERLIHVFITTRLDYCNSLLYGVPEYQIRKLQRVMNASARLVYCAPKYCHINSLLRELHWLPVKLHIDFKILLIRFKILQGLAPSYLRILISILPASHYQLCRINNGILLESQPFRKKKTIYGGSIVYGSGPSSIKQIFLWQQGKLKTLILLNV